MFVINSLVGHTYTFGEKNNEIKCTKLICNIQSWDLKFTCIGINKRQEDDSESKM